MNKYRARKTHLDGICFDSQKEANRYAELKILERAGMIRDLSLQVAFVLQEAYVNGLGKKVREISYIADFVYVDIGSGITIVEDVKGIRTDMYRLKKKWFECKYAPAVITEV